MRARFRCGTADLSFLCSRLLPCSRAIAMVCDQAFHFDMLDLSTAAVCTLVLAAASAGYVCWRRPRASELYDDADAILLNLKPPETRWFNMGLWTDSVDADDFPRAAEQLCRTVAEAARLQRGERICVSPRTLPGDRCSTPRSSEGNAYASYLSRKWVMALAIRLSCSQRNSARKATSATPRSSRSKTSRVRSETLVQRHSSPRLSRHQAEPRRPLCSSARARSEPVCR